MLLSLAFNLIQNFIKYNLRNTRLHYISSVETVEAIRAVNTLLYLYISNVAMVTVEPMFVHNT